MANIFTSENIMKYAVSTAEAHGEIGEYNGCAALKMGPSRFWTGSDYKHILEDEFEPNTQYNIDIWVNEHNLFDANPTVDRGNGIRIYYSDGSYKEDWFYPETAGGTNWQHIKYTTTKGKSVSYFVYLYSRNYVNFWRLDSFITPADGAVNIQRIGVTKAGHFNEPYDIASSAFGKNWILTKDFIEI